MWLQLVLEISNHGYNLYCLLAYSLGSPWLLLGRLLVWHRDLIVDLDSFAVLQDLELDALHRHANEVRVGVRILVFLCNKPIWHNYWFALVVLGLSDFTTWQV